ncbi:MAG: hypothetical protein AAB574_01515 [Patescibacteria group bacterium]
MRRWRFWVIAAVLAVWWWVGLKIGYPPTEEQLLVGLWPVFWTRSLCFGLIIVSFWFWYKIFIEFKLSSLYFYFVLVLSLSPTLFGLFWLHPVESLKWFLFSGIFWLSSRWKRKSLVLPIIFLLAFSFWQNKEKARIWEIYEPTRAKLEVTEKFIREDNLIEKIELPLWWRRISYNKISWMMSSTLKELISFWDLEPWFFQEIHPAGKKALILFYWPGFLLALLGLYSGLQGKKMNYKKMLGYLGCLAFFGYLFSKSDGSLRYSLILPFLAFLIAEALIFLRKSKLYLMIFLLLFFYGYQAFIYDLSNRPDYWLDNRPLVYKYFFETVRNLPGKIQVTDRVANAVLYCQYFLGGRCDANFTLAGFNFKESPPQRDISYAGFEGEFVGPNFKNFFPDNITKRLTDDGFEVVSFRALRDNIANQYGFNLVVAKLK